MKVYEDAKKSKDDKRILQALKDAHVKLKLTYKACDRKQHPGTIGVLEKYDQLIKKEARDLDKKIKASRGQTPQVRNLKASELLKIGLSVEESKGVWDSLKRSGYIDNRGKVQDNLRTALKNNTLKLPRELSEQERGITEFLRSVAG